MESELAILLKKSGDLKTAEAHLSRGIDTMKRIGDSCNLPQRLKELATLKVSRGDLVGANAVYDEITDLTEGMIASSNTEYAKASLIGALSDVFVNHFTLLADRLRDTQKAFEVLERARGRASLTGCELVLRRTTKRLRPSGPFIASYLHSTDS